MGTKSSAKVKWLKRVEWRKLDNALINLAEVASKFSNSLNDAGAKGREEKNEFFHFEIFYSQKEDVQLNL